MLKWRKGERTIDQNSVARATAGHADVSGNGVVAHVEDHAFVLSAALYAVIRVSEVGRERELVPCDLEFGVAPPGIQVPARAQDADGKNILGVNAGDDPIGFRNKTNKDICGKRVPDGGRRPVHCHRLVLIGGVSAGDHPQTSPEQPRKILRLPRYRCSRACTGMPMQSGKIPYRFPQSRSLRRSHCNFSDATSGFACKAADEMRSCATA